MPFSGSLRSMNRSAVVTGKPKVIRISDLKSLPSLP